MDYPFTVFTCPVCLAVNGGTVEGGRGDMVCVCVGAMLLID